jgi:hypothetical protein
MKSGTQGPDPDLVKIPWPESLRYNHHPDPEPKCETDPPQKHREKIYWTPTSNISKQPTSEIGTALEA